MKFKGKIAAWWYVAIGVLNGLAVAAVIYYGGYGPYALYLPITFVVDLYLVPVLFRNEVTLDKDFITVQFGLLKKQVLVKDVYSIKSSNSVGASFAASFDRLEINPRNKTLVYISLKEPQKFVNELLKLNKKIKYYG